MASIYTHNRFGLLLMEKMGLELRSIVTKYNDLYRLGQQGPDIFFFNLKLMMHKNSPGMIIHSQSGKDYLDHIKDMMLNYSLDSPQGAYFIGSLCHYILDSKIHPLVDSLEDGDYKHLDIETELDRYYLNKDGYKARNYRLDRLIPQTEQVYNVVPQFYLSYADVDEKAVINGIKGFSLVKKFFITKTIFKEVSLYAFLKIIGKEKFRALIMRSKPFEQSKKSNLILSKCFDETLNIAVDMIENAINYIYYDGVLMDDFCINYDGILV